MVSYKLFKGLQVMGFRHSKTFIVCLIFIVCYSLEYCSDNYIDYTFQLSKEGAKQVQIEGDFTGWTRIPMEKSGKVWMKTFKLKSNKIYEYRFVVDNTVENDPKSKNRSVINNTSVLFLDSSGQQIKIDKKDIDVNMIRDTIKELLSNQRKFLEELELIRNEIVKRDLQIELLKMALDKSEVDRKEKYESLQTIKLQYEQLSKKLAELESEAKKNQETVDSARKDYKNMQNNYFSCLKMTEKLKKQIKSLQKKHRRKTHDVAINPDKSVEEPKIKLDNIVGKGRDQNTQPKTTYTRIGKIYEVSDTSNLVVIYVEGNNGVSTADILYVLRNDEVVATLAVTSVEKDWCYAKVVSGNKNDVKKQDVYIISPSK